MSRIWYTSDLHLGHELVAGLRGYDSTAEHDIAIIERWQQRIRPTDAVFVLGDIALAEWGYALRTLRGLPGTKHLISGNHDAVHPKHSTALRQLQNPEVFKTFATVQPFLRRKLMKRTVMLSHFPYDGEGDRDMLDRDVEYRLRDRGHPLVHGHTHDATQLQSRSLRGSHQFHVGWDAHRDLVPENVIIDWLNLSRLQDESNAHALGVLP